MNADEEPTPIQAAGGVVYRQESGRFEVLLIHRNGKWDLPKGKHEPGESLQSCAAREVSEEVGSSMPALVSGLGTTYHEYRQDGVYYGKTTYWYSMIFTRAEESFQPQEEEGINRVEWADLDEAMNKVGYDNLHVVLERFREQKKA